MSFALVFGLAALVLAFVLGGPRWRDLRRHRWAKRPFPAEWRAILRRRVPLYGRMPAPLQQQVRRHVQVFLAEKPFIGCAGLEVTDEMRVTVAAQAALLHLNRDGAPFPGLRQVLLYPGAFAVDRVRTEPGGILREERQALTGESWAQGQVILSWADVVEGARVPDDGRNVVLHEFAHQLDHATGATNGAPGFASPAASRRWSEVMNAEYEALRARIRAREARRGLASSSLDAEAEPELISDYGATQPPEFFAVATEVFFEQPDALARRHPPLFAVLRDHYRVDPREWH